LPQDQQHVSRCFLTPARYGINLLVIACGRTAISRPSHEAKSPLLGDHDENLPKSNVLPSNPRGILNCMGTCLGAGIHY
jgi:hypothetical protein